MDIGWATTMTERDFLVGDLSFLRGMGKPPNHEDVCGKEVNDLFVEEGDIGGCCAKEKFANAFEVSGTNGEAAGRVGRLRRPQRWKCVGQGAANQFKKKRVFILAQRLPCCVIMSWGGEGEQEGHAFLLGRRPCTSEEGIF